MALPTPRLSQWSFLLLVMASLISWNSFRTLHFYDSLAENSTHQPDQLQHDFFQRTQEIAKLRQELQRIQNATKNTIQHEDAKIQSLSTFVNHSSVCDVLEGQSAMSLWSSHLPLLLNASQYPRDVHFYLHDFTVNLLQEFSTERLHRSIQSIPLDMFQVKRVLDIAFTRYKYLQTTKPNRKKKAAAHKSEPPKLQIVVMGGSVTEGRNCASTFGPKWRRKYVPIIKATKCRWTHHLSHLLQNILGDVVEIHNIAQGGTNSETGRFSVEYDLLPIRPDILIHAYATNDVHHNSIQRANEFNQTLQDVFLDLTQDFVRATLDTDCPPLLLYLNDYLGNEQHDVWATMMIPQTLTILSQYYGFGYISYPETVRDIVYGDTTETWFSPEWWDASGTDYHREIHPPLPMHMVTSWIVAYNFLNLAVHSCDQQMTLPKLIRKRDRPDVPANKTMLQKYPQAKPQNRLPPKLTPRLSLASISQIWKNSPPRHACRRQTGRRCPFYWTRIGNADRPNAKTPWDKTKFAPYIVDEPQWNMVSDKGKEGLVPMEGVNSTMALVFPQVNETLGFVLVSWMKSYGLEWESSVATLRVLSRESSNDWRILNETVLEGFHRKETSESYTQTLKLGEAGVEPGHDLRVEFCLQRGIKFKVMAFGICKQA